MFVFKNISYLIAHDLRTVYFSINIGVGIP